MSSTIDLGSPASYGLCWDCRKKPVHHSVLTVMRLETDGQRCWFSQHNSGVKIGRGTWPGINPSDNRGIYRGTKMTMEVYVPAVSSGHMTMCHTSATLLQQTQSVILAEE